MATFVLVLFASGGLHHDPTCHGNGVGHHQLFFSQTHFWVQANGVRDRRYRRAGVHRLGAPYVHVGNESLPWHDLHDNNHVDCVAECSEGVQLAGDDVGW